ncbi:MAG: ASPIC/UnbV domain-containing protein [Planctomycetes bacterium]|nr:ASPIC/UnbV domain-containing protein [Planctomycetota bacterium]
MVENDSAVIVDLPKNTSASWVKIRLSADQVYRVSSDTAIDVLDPAGVALDPLKAIRQIPGQPAVLSRVYYIFTQKNGEHSFRVRRRGRASRGVFQIQRVEGATRARPLDLTSAAMPESSAIDLQAKPDHPGYLLNTTAAESFLAVVQQGMSFSARERHCCFLNVRDGTFANISGPSGLDVPDDGRGVALVDWDLDGDLDLWISNRSGPQVRMFRNDLETPNQFVAVKLQGDTCNRDAIGARLELHLKGESVPLLRTLRAGDGFLSQSSKWIHFGLGETAKIDRLVVKWPGGVDEEFRDLTADRRYRIVQGAGRPERWQPPERTIAIAPSAWKKPSTTSTIHLVSADWLDVPTLPYQTFDGQTRQVAIGSPAKPGSPVLLNLWASWCRPCVEELTELSKRREEIRETGLRVVALSVETLMAEDGSGSAAAKALADRIDLSLETGSPETGPFDVGLAEAAVPAKLQILNNLLFDLHQPLPVPSSFLIDRQGRLVAIYKGPVGLDKVFDDLATVDLGAENARLASLPFAGRWIAGPQRLHPIALALPLARRGYAADAAAIYERHEAIMSGHTEAARLLLDIGVAYESAGDAPQAVDYYRRALEKARVMGNRQLAEEIAKRLRRRE